MLTKTWRPQPVYTAVIELLQRKGPMTDVELYNMIKDLHGELGFNVLNKELMKLELKGIIHVSALARGKRQVELVKKQEKHTGGKT